MTEVLNANNAKKNQTTLAEAKKVLGTTAKGLSDEAIMRLVTQVDVLTDIVAAHFNDSNIHSCIDISNDKLHTEK